MRDPVTAYFVSKVIAEKAAWDFVWNMKLHFTITTLFPSLVYGPNENLVGSTRSLKTSSVNLHQLFNGLITEVPQNIFSALVVVRDLVNAHLLAYESVTASNQRYLVFATSFNYQKFVNIIGGNLPELRETTPEGDPNGSLPEVFNLDNTKSVKELGITYRSLEMTVIDSVRRLKEIENSF